MKSVKVIKVGGKVIDDDQNLDAFLASLVSIKGPKVLVHGGGSIASKMGERLGIKPNTMVYGGLVNKKIVAKLQALGANAVGLSGADLNIIPAKKRNPEPIDFGWVGDVEKVNTQWISEFLNGDVIPVLAPLTHDGSGHMLNTNADTIASKIASALSEDFETELMFCFEQSGVMNEDKLITELNLLLYRHLKGTGIVTEGMIPKLDLGFAALTNGVKKVSVRSFKEVYKPKSGTTLVS